MKTMRFFAAFAAAACLWACIEKDDPINPGGNDDPVVTPEISVSPSTVAFEADGGTLRVAVTTNQDSYTVSGASAWLTVTQNGNEISLTAEENTVNEARTCTLTVTADTATASIEVSQKPGSPYKGYASCKSAILEYGGTTLYMFMKPTEEDYGGWGMLNLTDEDDNSLVLWIYTDLFQSEEEVELTTGTYVKGNDDYNNLSLCAKKLTYMIGFPSADEEDDYVSGSFFRSMADETDFPIVDGTVEVSREGSVYTIKADMTDNAGNAHKYVYIGEVTIDAQGASYPSTSDHIDVASTVFAAECYYFGDRNEAGSSSFELYIYSGDPQGDYAVSVFELNTASVEYSESIDISGIYTTPGDPETDPEALAPYSPGTLVPGSLFELFPGFELPFGTYVMYSAGDYLIGDAFDSLMLTKEEDGTYTINVATIMSSNEDFVMFMGVGGLEIPIINGTAYDED